MEREREREWRGNSSTVGPFSPGLMGEVSVCVCVCVAVSGCKRLSACVFLTHHTQSTHSGVFAWLRNTRMVAVFQL